MFKDNLIHMRKMRKMTQEDLAEQVGVTRQAIAKWESGETIPDLEKCRLLAEAFGISLDDLANYEPVTVGDRGQIVIPAKARKLFNISPGDELVVLGDESQGMAIIKAQYFLTMADAIRREKH